MCPFTVFLFGLTAVGYAYSQLTGKEKKLEEGKEEESSTPNFEVIFALSRPVKIIQ